MRVVVVGAGAVGVRLAAAFLEGGHAVTLVVRPAELPVIREGGVRVEGPSPQGPFHPEVVDAPRPDQPDAVVLAVKAFDVASAATGLARGLGNPSPLLLPQNGLGIEAIADRGLRGGGWPVPEPWRVRAVNNIPSTWLAPGVVRGTGKPEVLLPDPIDAGRAGVHVPLFVHLFESSGILVRTTTGFRRELWRKAIVNAAVNPVTALRSVPNGDLLSGPFRSEALVLLREANRAAAAAGYPFEEAEIEADFDRVVRASAANRSSMLQDLDRGRPTEIDAISGAILREAEAHHLDLPATRDVVRRIEERAATASRPPQPS